MVAEGVENEDRVERVKNLGCDLVQGFYVSKPLPATSVPDFPNGVWR